MYIREKTIQSLKTSIEEAINKAIRDNIFEIEPEQLPAVIIEVPREKEHGDFACTVAMQLPRLLHKNPRVIAETIVENLDLENLPVQKVDIAGPGFINFTLEPLWNREAVEEVFELGENYGRSEKNAGKTYNMEFVSANPTGPMHVGNARGGAIGDVLAALADWSGYDVTREFYVNDAGNQIAKLSKSLEARYQQETGNDVPFPEDGYQGEDVLERVKEYLSALNEEEKIAFAELPAEERSQILSDFTVNRNLERMKKDLKDYGIEYDVWFSEQSLYDNHDIEKALELLKQSGKVYEKDGAIWFKATDYDLPKDDVLIRDNGIPTYFMGDIAYHLNKFVDREFDRGVNVWGADHYGHVARLKAALEAAGAGDKLEIVLMQLVKLLRDNEVVTMSKRTGKMITLSDLVEDIGQDAARFFFNLRSPESHLEFDLDLAIEESNENPVFYVQYAHARIASILRNLEDIENLEQADITLLKEKEELNLIDILSRFPDEILIAENSMDPSRMTRYALDLASAFHSFYSQCRVNVEDRELKRARAALVKATKQVLKNVSDILGIEAPESM